VAAKAPPHVQHQLMDRTGGEDFHQIIAASVNGQSYAIALDRKTN